MGKIDDCYGNSSNAIRQFDYPKMKRCAVILTTDVRFAYAD